MKTKFKQTLCLSTSNYIMENKSGSLGIWEWQLVKLIVFGALGLFTLFLGLKGISEEGVRLIIQWTAKIDVLCFCIAFGAASFHRTIKNSFSFWVYMNRKYFGISFAILHLIHLITLAVLQYSFHPVFEKAANSSLVAGGLAYLFVILMLLTSFERYSKMISRRNWDALHTIGGYWILGVFFITYLKRVQNEEYWALFFLLLIISVLGMRLIAIKRRKKHTG